MAHSDTKGLVHHFTDLRQQHESATLGMWSFLVTEILFFGGLILAYVIFRNLYPEVWLAASHELDWVLGGVNTFVLLFSSLTMAMAVRAAHHGHPKATFNWLGLTIIFGVAFLVVKYFEYSSKVEHHLIPGTDSFTFNVAGVDPSQAQIFFIMYFAMTGVHALHMIVGVGWVAWIMRNVKNRKYSAEYYAPVEMTGLYWHFVDIVWIFLYPLLYLIDLTDQATGGDHARSILESIKQLFT